jgi:hypothetical protein
MHTYIHACMHACMHTYVRTYMHRNIDAYLRNLKPMSLNPRASCKNQARLGKNQANFEYIFQSRLRFFVRRLRFFVHRLIFAQAGFHDFAAGYRSPFQLQCPTAATLSATCCGPGPAIAYATAHERHKKLAVGPAQLLPDLPPALGPVAPPKRRRHSAAHQGQLTAGVW